MEPTILLIETSTEWCSAALLEKGKITAERIEKNPRRHASLTAPFAAEVLKERNLTMADCDAVAVSAGPGSYTGLRVGVSTAKGLCFGAGKPLIGIDTLEILARKWVGKADFIVPMVDARRMEVYSAVFDGSGRKITETAATVLDENSFTAFPEGSSVVFVGNGVEKFEKICRTAASTFDSCCPEARFMGRPAAEAFKAGKFEDTAYFEPFYLKEFIAGISKKSVL